MTARAKLGDVLLDIEAGKSFQTAETLARPHELGVLKVSAVTWSNFQSTEAKALISGYTPADSHRVRGGDFIISRANTKEFVGAVVLVGEDYPNRLLSDKTLRLVVDETKASKEFLLFALRSKIARDHIEEFATGTSDSMRNISHGVIRSIPIPFGDIDSQRVFARRLKAQLAEVETARAAVTEQLSDVKALTDAVYQETFNSVDVPIEKLGTVLKGIQAGKSFLTAEYLAGKEELGVLKVSAVSWQRFRPDEAKALLDKYIPNDMHRVRKGDLLISRANTKELIGAVVLCGQDYPNRLLSDKTLRLLVDENRISKDYLLTALRLPLARKHIEHFATGTSDSMRNISQPIITGIPIPLPTLPEQHRIANKLKSQLAEIDAIRSAILQRADDIAALPQRILASAFEM